MQPGGPEITRLTRTAASEAVSDLGWRYVLGTLFAWVRVETFARSVEVAAWVVEAAGEHADDHLRIDLRRDRVVLMLQTSSVAAVTSRDVDVARLISAAVRDRGLRTESGDDTVRSVQAIEIAIDAIDIAAVRPFWKAVTGYVDEPGRSGPTDPLVDPIGQGPAIWFQRMSAPRPQRNRIHLDVSVPHDEAPARIAATLAAGGVLIDDEAAPAFWVFADVEGNEACVTTWQGRDN
ncbi:VOC family protein [Actinopolymorpha pittospori]|uniref:Putative pterin-4-alpha-carbinolamine dehydratase n=1 Tax=Actinopolymorpha pittospori TaxID=648752 RepID=A0A927N5K2_9ACTN|nr:VOC family protein [Actinopolymorpha pittospori]MBE1612539.1 4a-hydroxytetrahydrobiopterin dehydratase [Actinopolymorpha pittospori]